MQGKMWHKHFFFSDRDILAMLMHQSNVREVSILFDHELINFFVTIIVFVQANIVFPFVGCQLSQATIIGNAVCPFDWASLSNRLWQKRIFQPLYLYLRVCLNYDFIRN